MLDEEEYKRIHETYIECTKRTKVYRETTGSPLDKTPLSNLFKPVDEENEKITGVQDFQYFSVIDIYKC